MNTLSSPLTFGHVGNPRHKEIHATRTRGSQGGPHSNKTISMLMARGQAYSAGNECLSAHSLAWVDPETGEPLKLELRCDEAFRNGLELIGFERVSRMEPESTREHTNMNTNREHSTAAQSYADAHARHYAELDYPAALRTYDEIIALHPSAPEAQYARTQIHNIVRSVIPAKELLAAELELVLRYLRAKADLAATASP